MTMNETSIEKFDCVRYMREARNRISAEIAEMNHEELMRWLRSYRHTDPLLASLAARARNPATRLPGGDAP